jgi:hypothetical protein
MSDDAPKISYEERHEPGFLERLLLDRRPSVLNAVFFLCAVTAIAIAVFHLYVAAFGTPEGRSFRSVHLTAMLVLAIFMNPLFRDSGWQPVSVPGDRRNGLRWLGFSIDLALVLMVLFVEVWTLYDIDAFHMRYGEKELPDIIVGGIFIVLVLEATRRAVGWAMVIITGFFICHALYANYFFGFFYGPPVRFQKFIDTLFMSSDGIFGIPLHVCATVTGSVGRRRRPRWRVVSWERYRARPSPTSSPRVRSRFRSCATSATARDSLRQSRPARRPAVRSRRQSWAPRRSSWLSSWRPDISTS